MPTRRAAFAGERASVHCVNAGDVGLWQPFAHLKFEVEAGGGHRIKGICFGRTAPIEPGHMTAWKLVAERWNGRESAAIRVEQVFDQDLCDTSLNTNAVSA